MTENEPNIAHLKQFGLHAPEHPHGQALFAHLAAISEFRSGNWMIRHLGPERQLMANHEERQVQESWEAYREEFGAPAEAFENVIKQFEVLRLSQQVAKAQGYNFDAMTWTALDDAVRIARRLQTATGAKPHRTISELRLILEHASRPGTFARVLMLEKDRQAALRTALVRQGFKVSARNPVLQIADSRSPFTSTPRQLPERYEDFVKEVRKLAEVAQQEEAAFARKHLRKENGRLSLPTIDRKFSKALEGFRKICPF